MAMLRRVKEGLKKMAQRKKSLAALDVKKIVTRRENPEGKKEAPGTRETMVEQAKFSHPQINRVTRDYAQELPFQYEKDRIVLQVRDPRWIHAYWELMHQTLERLKGEFKNDFYRAKHLLRVYDVSQIIFNGSNAHRFFDIEVGEQANNWYIDTAGPGRSWCVDLGLLLADGRFITIVRSNIVHTPLEGPSWITDEEWMIPDDMFARLYGMGFGLGRSSPVGKAWQEKVRHVLSSGVTSGASPVKPLVKEKKFWLAVNCELIVYGATEPDAKVSVQGKPITLRQDGTFTLRFALPDGKHPVPVKAVSCDGRDERNVTPIVVRETK